MAIITTILPWPLDSAHQEEWSNSAELYM